MKPESEKSSRIYSQQEVEELCKEHNKEIGKLNADYGVEIEHLLQTIKEKEALIETVRKYNEDLLTRLNGIYSEYNRRMH
jgi:phage host-nuclease inhibitor protein Gam